MTTAERLVWLGAAILAVVLVGVLTSCGGVEKLLTRQTANGTRAALREACADIEAADRLAGAVLDDAGTP